MRHSIEERISIVSVVVNCFQIISSCSDTSQLKGYKKLKQNCCELLSNLLVVVVIRHCENN